ncbi:hypothetical protein BDW02DRAFT_297636 [Decorospora gaudefroyi]|uniref:Uncharacterized protein n=1 Tax=Decorospora gaudefroyi TaxID=184978 RepID=A0A6A5KGH7_9PLEO|nr:hypothetical protein BDW02DRAFT_297636 [Decorospora gaudefroyi]
MHEQALSHPQALTITYVAAHWVYAKHPAAQSSRRINNLSTEYAEALLAYEQTALRGRKHRDQCWGTRYPSARRSTTSEFMRLFCAIQYSVVNCDAYRPTSRTTLPAVRSSQTPPKPSSVRRLVVLCSPLSAGVTATWVVRYASQLIASPKSKPRADVLA